MPVRSPPLFSARAPPTPHAGLQSWAEGSPEHVSLDSALVLPLFFSSDNPSRLGHPPPGGGAGLYQLCRPRECYRSCSQDGFPWHPPALSGLILGLQGPPVFGEGSPGCPGLGRRCRQRALGSRPSPTPTPEHHQRRGGRARRAWGAEEDGERMRRAFTGICASETVQAQEDGRCVTAPLPRPREEDVGAERGARGALTGRSFSHR